MDRFRFEAMLEEFPFLKETVEGRDSHHCDGIQIKRIDENVLQMVPSYSGATGSCVGISDRQAVGFVLKDGRYLSNAVRDRGYCVHNEAHCDNKAWDGETILEAIDRHGVGDSLSHIVLTESGYVIRDHHSQSNWRATIYKPAKAINIRTSIAEARTSALAKVQAEAEF